MRVSILVVDDDRPVRELIERNLRFAGYDVAGAADGEGALAWIAEHHVDVVVTDLRMPGIDGIELLRRLRGHHPLVRVIVMTGHATIDHALSAIRAGADTLLLKPIADLAVLEAAVADAVTRLQRWLDLLRDLRRRPAEAHG